MEVSGDFLIKDATPIARENVIGYSAYKEPIYRNYLGDWKVDPPLDFSIRNKTARLVKDNRDSKMFDHLFKPVSTPNGLYLQLNGITMTNKPSGDTATWEDYDIYTSTASHIQIERVACNDPTRNIIDNKFLKFSLTQFVWRGQKTSIVVDISPPIPPKIKEPNQKEIEAILRRTQAEFYTIDTGHGFIKANPYL